MKASTRNQVAGTARQVHAGEAMATVKVQLGGGEVITAAITAGAVQDLGLEPGSSVTVLVKSTEVMLRHGMIAVIPASRFQQECSGTLRPSGSTPARAVGQAPVASPGGRPRRVPGTSDATGQLALGQLRDRLAVRERED